MRLTFYVVVVALTAFVAAHSPSKRQNSQDDIRRNVALARESHLSDVQERWGVKSVKDVLKKIEEDGKNTADTAEDDIKDKGGKSSDYLESAGSNVAEFIEDKAEPIVETAQEKSKAEDSEKPVDDSVYEYRVRPSTHEKTGKPLVFDSPEESENSDDMTYEYRVRPSTSENTGEPLYFNSPVSSEYINVGYPVYGSSYESYEISGSVGYPVYGSSYESYEISGSVGYPVYGSSYESYEYSGYVVDGSAYEFSGTLEYGDDEEFSGFIDTEDYIDAESDNLLGGGKPTGFNLDNWGW